MANAAIHTMVLTAREYSAKKLNSAKPAISPILHVSSDSRWYAAKARNRINITNQIIVFTGG